MDDFSPSAARPPDADEPDESRDAGPPPIQFRLKSLLIVTTLVSVVLAALLRVSAVGGAVLIWFLLLVAAHVSANFWGTRAVDHAPVRRGRAGGPDRDAIAPAVAPTTRLGRNERLGSGLFIATAVGGLVGAVVGTTLIFLHNQGRLGVSGFLLGGFSSAVIGAFFCFLAGSCIQVSARALRQASQHGAAGRRRN